jgi:hypothetical protein
LRDGDDIGIYIPEIAIVLNDGRRLWPCACHQACTGRATNRLLAVGSVEQEAALRQGVNIWRFGDL